MLVIRNAQIDRFGTALLESLNLRVRDDLRTAPAAQSLPPAQLATLASRSMKEARRFRLPDEAALRRFAAVLAQFCGPDIARPLPLPALQILMSYGPPADARLARFADWVAAHALDPAGETS
jgi:hypothetical protein